MSNDLDTQRSRRVERAAAIERLAARGSPCCPPVTSRFAKCACRMRTRWSPLLTTPEITRFISAPPQTLEGFERFIARITAAARGWRGACFAATLNGCDTAIGLFQVRQVSPSEDEARQLGGAMDTAEWGFAIGSPFWGTGIFEQCAALLHGVRLRACPRASPGSALRRQERTRRQGAAQGRRRAGRYPAGKRLLCGDEYLDQVLYAIVEQDWRACRDRARASSLSLACTEHKNHNARRVRSRGMRALRASRVVGASFSLARPADSDPPPTRSTIRDTDARHSARRAPVPAGCGTPSRRIRSSRPHGRRWCRRRLALNSPRAVLRRPKRPSHRDCAGRNGSPRRECGRLPDRAVSTSPR